MVTIMFICDYLSIVTWKGERQNKKTRSDKLLHVELQPVGIQGSHEKSYF
jgi:hypothetical protein